MGLSVAIAGAASGHAAGRGRDDVHDPEPERRRRAERGDGKADLDLPVHAGSGGQELLRTPVPGRRDFGRHDLSGRPSTRGSSPSTPRPGASCGRREPAGDPKQGYAFTHAPLVVKDKVIAGTAGGEFGVRGFIAAWDVKTGKEVWRFNTVPGPGEPGHESWSGDSWMHGGAPIWVTGSYDPETNLTYWGTGNPGPDWDGAGRRRRQPV